MGDANAANFRYLNHFFETNLAQSVREYDRVLRRNQGIPWVNSIAADSKGEAYYADIGVVPNVSNAKAAACNTALGTQTTSLLGIPILDGSRTALPLGHRSRRGAAGHVRPVEHAEHVPARLRDQLERQLLAVEPQAAARGLRPDHRRRAHGARAAHAAGAADRPAAGQVRRSRDVQNAVFNNRQYFGELLRDALVAMCKANPTLSGSSGPVDVSAGLPECSSAGTCATTSTAAGPCCSAASRAKALAAPGGLPTGTPPGVFDVPFDPNDPVNTPRGLNTDSPTVRGALADAVKELRDQGIPLDARLREYQYEMRGRERIPIHGGPGTLGVFNAISAPFKAREGFPDIVHGSSFVMAAHLNGTRCPDSRSILTYSLSANPESPHYADQTRLFSRKGWVDMRFCAEEILRARRLAVLELGCVRDSGLRSARVRRASRRRVRLAFRRRLALPVKVEVFRASAGRLRRVARTPALALVHAEAAPALRASTWRASPPSEPPPRPTAATWCSGCAAGAPRSRSARSLAGGDAA